MSNRSAGLSPCLSVAACLAGLTVEEYANPVTLGDARGSAGARGIHALRIAGLNLRAIGSAICASRILRRIEADDPTTLHSAAGR